MSKDPPANDKDLFKQAMADVTPLKSKARLPTPLATQKPIRRQNTFFTEETAEVALSDHCSIDILAEQYLEHAKSGLQPGYLKQLKQGKLAIEAELDLHGFSIAAAKQKLLALLAFSQSRGYRCLRVIHGKGYRGEGLTPILKSKVYTWLCQHPAILAFCSCQPQDGGTGAVYVLLQRNHQQR